MHRFAASAALLALASLLPACGTLVGHEVHENLLEMQMDGAKVSFSEPAHCANPGYRADFLPGAGITMSLKPRDFTIEIEPGRSLAFRSAVGRIALPDGGASDLFIRNVQAIPTPGSVWTSVPADSLLAGVAPPGRHSSFSGNLAWSVPDGTKTFMLQLPDAIVNGQPYRFAPVRFSVKPTSYFQDACLR